MSGITQHFVVRQTCFCKEERTRNRWVLPTEQKCREVHKLWMAP